MAQRISRAKQTIKTAGADVPPAARRRARRAAARRAARALPGVQRGVHDVVGRRPAAHRPHRRGDPPDPRRCTQLLPDDGEVAGLLALMLLTDARRARAHAAPTARSCRSTSRTAARWDRALIAEGVALVTQRARAGTPLGPYQLQAAIAAVHDEAPPRGRHRLAADPRALRAARAHRAQPDGDAQPRRRGRRGARARRRARAARVARRRRPHRRPPPRLRGACPPARAAPATSTAARAAYREAARRTTSAPSNATSTTAPPASDVWRRSRCTLGRRKGSGQCHWASSMTVLAGPTRKTSLRSWKSIGLVAGREPGGLELGDGGVEVVDAEADVVEAGAGEVARRAVDELRGLVEVQELHLLVRLGVGDRQRDVIGFHPGDAHVRVHRRARRCCTVLMTSKPSTPKNWIASSRSKTATVDVVEGRCTRPSRSGPLVELHVVALRVAQEHAAHEPARGLAVHRVSAPGPSLAAHHDGDARRAHPLPSSRRCRRPRTRSGGTPIWNSCAGWPLISLVICWSSTMKLSCGPSVTGGTRLAAAPAPGPAPAGTPRSCRR